MNTFVPNTRPATGAQAAAAAAGWLSSILVAWRTARRRVVGRRAFDALDAAALRDLGMSRGEYDSFEAEASGLAPRTRVRTGGLPATAGQARAGVSG